MFCCRLDQSSDIPGHRAVREELNAAQKARGCLGPRRGGGGREQGPRVKRSNIQQLKVRTRCARCRKLGHWARECSEGNRGQRNDERYERRAGRPEDSSKKFISLAGPTERRRFLLGATWTFVTLDPGGVLWDIGARGTRRERATETEEQTARGVRFFRWNGVMRNQNLQAVPEVRRSQSVLYTYQLVASSSASLSWSRMFHHSCRWE